MAENVSGKAGPMAARRDFLKLALLGVAGGAVAAATRPGEAEAATAGGKAEAGYRETPHIRTYYDLARF